MVNAIKVSVIVPAYRVAPYIHECLLSLLAQNTDFPFEVIVANDASPDNTLQIIGRLAHAYPNLKVLDNPKNLGLPGTMRRLLSEARGQYIAYLDGDDLALPGKLQQQADYLDTHPQCGMVYHESEVFDSDSGAILRLYSRDHYNARYIPQVSGIEHLIQYGAYLQASSIMFRRHDHLIEALDHDCRIICDYPWHIANAGYLNQSIDRIDEVLGRYRVHAQSFTAQTGTDDSRRVLVTEEQEKACLLAHGFDVAPDIVNSGLSHIRFAAALYFLKKKSDLLFEQMIEKSAEFGLFFDDRHRMAFERRAHPETVRKLLGWSA